MKQTIQQLRLARGWSQEDLAREMNYDRRRVSKLENGLGATPRDEEALAAAFRCSVGDIELAPARKAGGQVVAEKELLRLFRPAAPEPPFVDRNGASRLPGLRKSHPELMRVADPLIEQNPTWQRFLAKVGSGSGEETGHHVWELTVGARALEVASAGLGFDLWPHVDQKTWRCMARVPVPALMTPHWLWVPQFTVVTPRRWCLDGLVIVREPQRTALDLEVDGFGHNPEWDRERERDLGMLTLRIPAGQIGRGPTLTERLQAMGFCLPRGGRGS